VKSLPNWGSKMFIRMSTRKADNHQAFHLRLIKISA
jgi:hypothetical protein